MRLEITRRAELGVRAMAALRHASTKMKAQEIADTIGATPHYIPQVIGPLVKAGWVSSDPGPTGGYLLTEEAQDVTVLTVVEQIDGPTDDGICVVASGPCDSLSPCILHESWENAREVLVSSLDRMPLDSIEWSHSA